MSFSNKYFIDDINKSPIGILDSGIGGLTVLKAVRKCMPNENIVYFGDTNRVPYGQKSKDEIVKYATQAINFLKSKMAKTILIACGTATSYIYDIVNISGKTPPVFGIIESASRGAIRNTRNGKIGVICTPVSARVGLYEKTISNLNPEYKVYTLGCPILAPLIEKGITDKNYDEINSAVKSHIDSLKNHDVDTVILGCTHYPIIRNIISEHTGNNIFLVDPGEEVATSLKNRLENLGINNKEHNEGRVDFFVSGNTQKFGQDAGYILDMENVPLVGQVNIESY